MSRLGSGRGQAPFLPRYARGIVHETWARVLWLLVLGVLARVSLLIRQRDSSQFETVDGYAALEITLLFVTGAVLLLTPAGRIAISSLRCSSLKYGVLLYFLGAISCLWSPLPAYSLFRATEAIIEILAICAVVFSLREAEAGERLLLATFTILLVFHFGSIFRTYGLSLSSRSFHTNSYSASAAMVLPFCAAEILRRQNVRIWIMLALSTAALLIGTSAGSNIATLAGVLVVGLMQSGRKKTFVILLVALFGLCALVSGMTGIRSILAPNKTDAELQDLSGRTRLWEEYSHAFFEHPLQGQGFAVTSRLSTLYETNSHNSGIAVLAGLGLVGLLVTLLWLSSNVLECYRAARRGQPYALGFTGSLVAGWINAMSCAFIGEGWSSSTVTFFMLTALFARFSPGNVYPPLRVKAMTRQRVQRRQLLGRALNRKSACKGRFPLVP